MHKEPRARLFVIAKLGRMDNRRLRIVSDISPVPGNGSLCPSGTKWQGSVAYSTAPIINRADGYTTTVMRNPVISWFRTFTASNTPPVDLPQSGSLVTLQEWIPTSMAVNPPGWKRVSSHDLAAVSVLRDDYRAAWSEQARRHLRAFEKSGLHLALGTLADIDAIAPHSQVPKHMQTVFRNVVKRHLAVQPDTVDFLIARDQHDAPVAAFVAGNCDEILQSAYLLGGFHEDFAKHHPMVGLIDWWFRRSRERGYATVNFGDITPPNPLPFIEHGIGYSVFKTHFGIHRVWLPGSFWKLG